MGTKEKPYVLFVAEEIYSKVCQIKNNNPNFSNTDAIENYIGSKAYNEISNGKFHDNLFEKLEKNNFIDQKTMKKIPKETIRLLKIQKDMIIKQLIQFPDLYYTKSRFPLELSKRAFDSIWRMCESYELWCKETNQSELLILKVIE